MTVEMDKVDRSLARIEELPLSAILVQFNLNLAAGSPDSKRWVVRIEGAEFKEDESDGVIGGAVGSGRSTDVALIDLCNSISGRLMVIGVMTPERKEIQLPQKVTLD